MQGANGAGRYFVYPVSALASPRDKDRELVGRQYALPTAVEKRLAQGKSCVHAFPAWQRRAGLFEAHGNSVGETRKEPRCAAGNGIAFVKDQPGTQYTDLYARQIVDAAIDIYTAYLLLNQARHSDEKLTAASHYIMEIVPRVKCNCELIKSGDRSSLDSFETLAGPVPAE